MRREVITCLDKFMWLKRKLAEAHVGAGKACTYWKRGDRRLLEEAIGTDELAERVLLEMHKHIQEGTALFGDRACPFCVVLKANCNACPYARKKKPCSDMGSAWRSLVEALPSEARCSHLLTLVLWQQSGCYALAERLLSAREPEDV